ncbi:UDP-glucose 4-epimerase family protein [Pleionea sediminis]|uniref:UDP-glucose 4-epimerase family protein n=1 Tax=Pleionea sediminis TaxID=2569479 RepID=UPI00197C6C20|nr:SDR family oxidoreductase [Pleionea sediminis]
MIALTGESGFVGSFLAQKLVEAGYDGVSFCRNAGFKSLFDKAIVSGIDSKTEYADRLSKVECIIHVAARAHILNEVALDPLYEFRKVNTCGTLNLAQQASKAGVKRFIYISSIKVNGEKTEAGQAFTASTPPAPSDPYGISKYEAEQGLMRIASESGLEVVIIRPPLIYGPGVKANFQSMMKWLVKGIPLPLGAINNSRSLVSIDNLVSLIIHCIKHPAAANEIFMVSDDDDVSTTRLLQLLCQYLEVNTNLIPISQNFLKICFNMIGRQDLYIKLCSSLEIDISKTKELLNWKPEVSMASTLKSTATDFLKNNK